MALGLSLTLPDFSALEDDVAAAATRLREGGKAGEEKGEDQSRAGGHWRAPCQTATIRMASRLTR
jgi:hypothetical protein